jgi:hypothetical protein
MKIQYDSIQCESGFTITLHRTIRIPEDGKSHALPPSHGKFPMKRIEDYRDKVPETWRDHGGVFIPMYEREAMWIGFNGPVSAVKVAVGKINAVSGGKWTQELQHLTNVDGKDPEQDYVVAPYPQPWLDGCNIGRGQIRQFVAMQMGKGYTVEGQVSGKEEVGGIQILAMPAKPGAVPAAQYPRYLCDNSNLKAFYSNSNHNVRSTGPKLERLGAQMGLAQGGRMEQKISKDPFGIHVWDQSKAERIFVHIVDATLWKEITGEECPPCPIDASEYKGVWFTYDNGNPVVQGSGTLANIKPVSQKDHEHGFKDQQNDSPLDETKTNPVIALSAKHSLNVIKDGNW